jgi:uncharacterized protein YbjT (DUF2867 family)
MILVLGAAGYTGRLVTGELARRDIEVRGFVRDAAGDESARAAGASETINGDLRDLPSIESAVRGADGVFLLGPRFMAEEAAVGRTTIDAAARAGVRRVVFSGVYHPSISGLVNHQSKLEVEDHLYRSGLEFTILQPARFMHGLLLSSRNRILNDGVLADAFAPEARMSYVDYRDVAEVAAIAFAEDRLVGGTFELSARGEHTLHELAGEVGAAIGRPLRAERTPLGQYGPADRLLANPYAAVGFGRLRDYYDRHGFRGGNPLVLEAILGRPGRDIGSCAAALLAD